MDCLDLKKNEFGHGLSLIREGVLFGFKPVTGSGSNLVRSRSINQ